MVSEIKNKTSWTKCYVVEDPGIVDELQWVYVTSLSNPECRIVYGSQITDSMVCVDGNYNEGTCKVRTKRRTTIFLKMFLFREIVVVPWYR
jgi:hypothetical protein